MLKKLSSNWLNIVFLLIVYACFATTIIFNWKPILASIYDSFTNNYKQNGISVSLISDTLSTTDQSFSSNLYGKIYWIEALGIFNKISGKSIFLDTEDRYTVYKMDNGQLTFNYSGYDMSSYAENYKAFADDMNSNNIQLVYIQAPFKIDKYNNTLPYGMHDDTNELADEFLESISDYDNCDLREVIHENSMDYASLFYDTDHHWKTETGLWATGVITDMLIERYGIELDTSHLDKEDYSYTIYNNYFLGSQGKRTGIVYGGLDDFVLIEPNYETDYNLVIPNLDIARSGPYSETVLFKKYLVRDYYNSDPGRVYTGDNYSLMTIENHNSTNDTEILLVKDSFSKSVIPFLASTCKKLHVIDLRTFDGSVCDYAVQHNVDITVVLYNPSVVVDPEFFEFE